MKGFFSGTKFKILISIFVLVAGFTTYAAASGNLSVLPQKLLASIMVPFQRVSVFFSNGADEIWSQFDEFTETTQENEALTQELSELRNQLVDYHKIKAENDLYQKTLNIQDEHPEYTQVIATVIARDPLEKFYSFTIDKGTSSGIEVDDVVHCAEGLIGKVLEVGPNYSKVITILDPRLNVGSIISRTRELGTMSGDSLISLDGNIKLSYLPKETMANHNDIVVTTGGSGIFPKDLVLGTIDDILTDPSGKSNYAIVSPAAEIDSVTLVYVITDFTA